MPGTSLAGSHQSWGDGRALLLGEIIDTLKQRRDIQLKGSGRTPFSRGGDGKAALGPVLREYLIGESMHALGVPTSRALAAVTTGEEVYRETPLPGAILTRVAASHLRIGTFEYGAARGDVDKVRELADYAIERHYPDTADEGKPIFSILCSCLQCPSHSSGALDEYRFHPRGDEHRQYDHLWRNYRLRALCFYGQIFSRYSI